MTTGSGLDAQLGFAGETTVGTPVTVTKFLEFNSEDIKFDSGFMEPKSLRVGRIFKRSSRVIQSRRSVSGSLELPVSSRGMGTLWKHCVGSTATATQISTSTAYRQVHIPIGKLGFGLTIQIGRPEPTGTVRPFTFQGCKIVDWEFSISDGEVAMLKASVDGWDESTATALAGASYTSANLFSFANTTFKLGGTASTTGGLMSVSGGTAVATVVRDFSVKMTSPLDTERYGLGNSGVKREQLENDTPTITGKFGAEFARTELYDPFKAGTVLPLEFVATGAAIGTSGQNDTVSIILPALRIKSATPAVGGPDVVAMDVEWEGYDDEVNAPIQVMVISADTTL